MLTGKSCLDKLLSTCSSIRISCASELCSGGSTTHSYRGPFNFTVTTLDRARMYACEPGQECAHLRFTVTNDDAIFIYTSGSIRGILPT